MKEIDLTNSDSKALIDDEFYDIVSKFKWRLCSKGYPEICDKSLHRFISILLGKNWDLVDHTDRNKLNSQAYNLRSATIQQNACNQGKWKSRKCTSDYKGVRYRQEHGKWISQIKHEGKIYTIGSFNTEYEAAKAYDQVARQLHGEFAYLNFPDINEKIIDIDKVLNRKSHLTSKYMGVCYDKRNGKWIATVVVKENKKQKSLFNKHFLTELEAAKARDRFLIDNNLLNDHRKLNFPEYYE